MVTVSLTNIPFMTERIRVPRACAIEFPFSMIWGKPGDAEIHRQVMLDMLQAGADIQEPGTIVELPYQWAKEDFLKRDWWPEHPPPWMADQERIAQVVDFIQHGDPLA